MTPPGINPEQNNPYSSRPELAALNYAPGVTQLALEGPRKSIDATIENPRITIIPEVPLDTFDSPDGTKQELMAVLALGENVAVGVVRAADAEGRRHGFLTLFGEDGAEHGINLGALRNNEGVDLGCNSLANTVRSSGLSHQEATRIIAGLKGVSADHATMSLDRGRITVTDNNSLNGSAIYFSQEKRGFLLNRPHKWAVSKGDAMPSAVAPDSPDDTRRNGPAYEMSATSAVDGATGESVPGPTLDDPRNSGTTPPPAEMTLGAGGINPPEVSGASPLLSTEQRAEDEGERRRLNADIAAMISRVPDATILETFQTALQNKELIIPEGGNKAQIYSNILQTIKSGSINLSLKDAAVIRARIAENGFHESNGGIWNATPDTRTLQGRILISAKNILEDIVIKISASPEDGQAPKAAEKDGGTPPSSRFTDTRRRRGQLRERELPR